MNHFRIKNNQQGLTLIELLITISIISFLASTFFPTLGEARAKAEDARRISSIKNIQTEIVDQSNAGELSYVNIFSVGPVATKLQSLLAQTGIDLTEINALSDKDTYVLVYPLKEGGYWCVDASGVSKHVDALITVTTGPFSCALAVAPEVGPGAIDTNFAQSSANGPIYHGALQGDGKILLTGDFTVFNNVPVAGIVRLNTDGTVDTDFASNTYNFLDGNRIDALIVLDDRKILIAGDYLNLLRLNPDGTLDFDFGPVSVGVHDLAILDSGMIVAAHRTEGISIFNPDTGDRVVYNEFDPGGFVVKQVAVIPETQNIVATGNFQKYQGVSADHVVFMRNNGNVIAPTVTSGFDTDTISDIYVDRSASSLYFLGGFATYQNKSTRGIVKTRYDGNYISAFDSTTGFTMVSSGPKMMGNTSGKPVVVGGLDAYENVIIGNIVRLRDDGHLDEPSIFDGTLLVGNNMAIPVSGFSGGDANVVLIDSQGRMIVAGAFSQYKGVSVGPVIRLNP